jgi:[protein-PII] uridylyltransferase
MAAVLNQRQILDRRALAAEVAALAERGLPADAARLALIEILKAALAGGRNAIRRRFDRGASGTEIVYALSFLVDQIVRTIHEFAETRVFRSEPGKPVKVGLVAVGGYGRGELAPFSDVDLLFVVPEKRPPETERLIEYILYILWDLGLKVGHATRSVAEAIRLAKADQTILTTLLESRYVCGDEALYRELKESFQAKVVEPGGLDYVEAKLAERNERHQHMGDSRYVLEPNVKDGKGGLRDLHTLFWIAKYFYRVEAVEELVARGVLTRKEADGFDKAQNFLWTLRCHIHYLTGRADERLTFDLQPEIGRRMGYTDHAGSLGVERFMKHYFLVAKEVGDLTRIFCAAIDSESRPARKFSLRRLTLRKHLPDGFDVDGNRLTVARAGIFQKDPVNLLRLFRVAQALDLDIHPHALRLVTRSLRLVDQKLRENPEANRLFVEMLTTDNKDPEETLKRMNEAGVLGRFIPDFGRVVAQMQHDMYHVYTVDEHTIRAIGILHRIDSGRLMKAHPISSLVIRKIQARRVLYIAVLLHDIAKGRGGDHSALGAEVALKLCPRLGFSEEETETVAWLVRHHLLMSHTAQRRDINDSKTVSDFVNVVQSAERLRLLLVLTVVDMKATGPTVWNEWKAALLRELYFSSEDFITGGVLAERKQARIAQAQQALRAELPDWSDADYAAFAALGYPDYWLGLDTATQARHARLVRAAEREKSPITIDMRVDHTRGATELTIYTGDHPGLFSVIAGAIAVSGGNIVDAKIFTMTNGMALDAFWIQDTLAWGAESGGGPFEGRERLAALESTITKALGGKKRLIQELAARPSRLPSRTRVFKVVPRVLVDNMASSTHTVVEVNGRDRPGLLFHLTRTLTALGLQISNAKIATYGEKVVDVFYVKDVFGLKVENEMKIAQIKAALLGVLAEPEAEAAPAKGKPPAVPRSKKRSRARATTRGARRAASR